MRQPGVEPTARPSWAPEESGPAQSRAIRQRPASPASTASPGIARPIEGRSRPSFSRSLVPLSFVVAAFSDQGVSAEALQLI